MPEATIENFRETSKDDSILTEIINKVAKAQFVCCSECKQDRMKQAEAIVDFIKQKYMTALIEKKS